MIPQRNISLLSNRLVREGGRRIPEAVLERDYCLAWFLVGLSGSPLRDQLAFKGGTALKRCYFGDYRFSEDLDFTLTEDLSPEDIFTALDGIYAGVYRASGVAFRFSREDRKKHLNSHTFYLAYEGPLPSTSSREVKVDITIRGRLVCPLEERHVVRGYEEYADLPDDCSIRAYALDEIVVEKIVALTDRARNEPRDLYDIWYLVSGEHVDLAMLIHEIDDKLEFRGRARNGFGEELARKERRYKKLWSARLAPQMADLPRFDQVYRAVFRAMRAAGLTD